MSIAQRRQPRRASPVSGPPPAWAGLLLSVVSLVSTGFLVARYIFLFGPTIAAPAAPLAHAFRATEATDGSGRRRPGAGPPRLCADCAKVRRLAARAVSARGGG
nr:hypothetical protein StreXyl84_58570 [Streptomyces sp. Xyl84]